MPLAASCYIVSAEKEELYCKAGNERFSSIVNAFAGGQRETGGAALSTDEATLVLRFFKENYPLEVRLDTGPRFGQNVLPTSLKVTSYIASADAARQDKPHEWRLPFRFGSLVIDSHIAGNFRLDYPVNLAPFTDSSGGTTFQVRKSFRFEYGYRGTLFIAEQGSIPAKIDERELEFPGLGHYELKEQEVVESAGAAGEEFVQCKAGEASADGIPVLCAFKSHSLLAFEGTAALGEAAPIALSSDQDVAVATVPKLPATITIRAGAKGLPGKVLDEEIAKLTLSVELSVVGDEPVVGKTGFAAWSSTVTCAERYCAFDRESINVPFSGEPHFWAVSLGPQVSLVRLEEVGETKEYVFATAPGVDDFAGNIAIGNDNGFVESTGRLGKGSYRMDSNGLTRIDSPQ